MPLDSDFRLESPEIRRAPIPPPAKPTWRERARLVIAPILTAHQGRPRREIRKALRAVYPHYADKRSGRVYKVWCEECAYALRERTRKNPSRHKVIPAAEVMPSMRASVARAGSLEITAVLDVDLDGGRSREALTLESQLQ